MISRKAAEAPVDRDANRNLFVAHAEEGDSVVGYRALVLATAHVWRIRKSEGGKQDEDARIYC
jgi:hypothetical protein